MAVGLNPSKAEIDAMAGVIARDTQAVLNRIREFSYFLGGKADADLEALGYSASDVAALRTAFLDLDQLVAIYRGELAQLPQGKDFRTFVRRIFGMGDV